MILNEFPNLSWLKSQINRDFAGGTGWGGRILKQTGWPTVILNAQAQQIHRDDILGPLSLFTNLKGASFVGVDGYQVKVQPGYFFLTNPGQCYTLDILPQNQNTETFNIHFGQHFGHEVISSWSTRPETLLDKPREVPSTAANFYNRLYPMDDAVQRIVHSIKANISLESLEEEEKLFALLSHITALHRSDGSSKNRIAIRRSTQEEILRRLYVSTDYIYSFFDQDISLDELSRVSCLSKFHYLRSFKTAFGETPHQFITRVRVQRAKELLRSGTREVNTISTQVGFKDASSFSRRFRHLTGVYPSQYLA